MKFKKGLLVSLLVGSMVLGLTACGEQKPTEPTDEPATQTEEPAADNTDVAAPGEDAGFAEFPIGDDQEVGPLAIAGVYFQPVDMEPAGNSLSIALQLNRNSYYRYYNQNQLR